MLQERRPGPGGGRPWRWGRPARARACCRPQLGRGPAARSRAGLAPPLTAVELRVLQLLPTSTYPQIAAALYIARSTVKTHLRSVYHKLGAASRSHAIERALDLRLL